ncbi:MAG: type II toxin-antitoxin system HicA family toxin [Ferruginibacter sp.]|nr:type II toxin-antitoxin system HicA family toxin [Ferruginibacter sp.]
MSNIQIVLSGKDFVKLLEKLGFIIIRINGSHYRLKHDDGRITTIPVHKNYDLPKGLMKKIIRDDLKLSLEDFEKLVEKI